MRVFWLRHNSLCWHQSNFFHFLSRNRKACPNFIATEQLKWETFMGVQYPWCSQNGKAFIEKRSLNVFQRSMRGLPCNHYYLYSYFVLLDKLHHFLDIDQAICKWCLHEEPHLKSQGKPHSTKGSQCNTLFMLKNTAPSSYKLLEYCSTWKKSINDVATCHTNQINQQSQICVAAFFIRIKLNISVVQMACCADLVCIT